MVCSFKRQKKGIAITNAFQKFLDVSAKPENIVSQHVSRTSLSKVNKTPPKDPIWPSSERPSSTSWRCPEMKSRRSANLVLKDIPGRLIQDVLSGCPPEHVLGMMWSHQSNVSKFIFIFLLEKKPF